jgi:tetratricopeptide (TPR) repeat protein
MTRGRSCFLVCALLALLLGCASDEEQFQTFLQEAEAHMAVGEFAEARIQLQRALKLQPDSGEVNLLLGRVAYAQGRLEDAFFYYQEGWRLNPEDPEPALEAAGLIVSEDPDTAEDMVEEVLERFPDSAGAYGLRAAVALVRVEPDAALAAALTATKLGPDDARNWLTLGRVYMGLVRLSQAKEGEAAEEDYVAGLAAFDRAVELGGVGTINGLERARFLSSWPERREDAPAAYREVLAGIPEWDLPLRITVATAIVRFGELRRDTEMIQLGMPVLVEADPTNLDKWDTWARLENSISAGGGYAVYERLLAARPDDEAAHDRYAYFLITDGAAERAVTHLDEVAERLSSPAIVLSRLADAHAVLGEDEEAAAIIARLDREYPDDPQTKVAHARQLMRESQNAEAAVLLSEVASRIETREVYYLLALAEYRSRDLSKAEAAVQTAIRLAGRFDIELVRLRASIRYQARDWVNAIRIMQRIVRHGYRLTPAERVQFAAANYELGRSEVGRQVLEAELKAERPTTMAMRTWVQREGRGDPDRARELMDEVMSRQPENPRFVRERARIELIEGDNAAALALVDDAIARGVDIAGLRLYRASLLASAGDLDGALAEANRVREADPDNGAAQRLITRIYSRQDRTDELRANLVAAYEQGTLDVTGRLTLASLELSAQNYAQARVLYEELLLERPEGTWIQTNLAYVLAEERQELDRALELAQNAVAKAPEQPRMADTLGYVYLRKGLTEPALSQFDAALRMDDDAGASDRARIHYHRGLALAELGRAQDADAAFAEARNLDPELEMSAGGSTGS